MLYTEMPAFFFLSIAFYLYIGMIHLIALAIQIHSGERQDNFNGRDKIDIRTAWFTLLIFYCDKTITIFIKKKCVLQIVLIAK